MDRRFTTPRMRENTSGSLHTHSDDPCVTTVDQDVILKWRKYFRSKTQAAQLDRLQRQSETTEKVLPPWFSVVLSLLIFCFLVVYTYFLNEIAEKIIRYQSVW